VDLCFFLTDGNASGILPPFDPTTVDFLRKARYFCDVSSKRVDVVVSANGTQVDVYSEDSFVEVRPRTHFSFIVEDVFQWTTERFDHYNDTVAASRLRVRLAFVHEFRPRNNSVSDPDFQSYGLDPTQDNITTSYNLSDPTQYDNDPITDLGSIYLYGDMGNTSLEATAFRRIFKCAIRYGPTRLGRIIISHIAANIRNGFNDSEVTVPGGVSYNFQLDNILYRANDTSFALEFDVDMDFDDGTLNLNSSNIYTDAFGGLTLQDNSEGHVDFAENDTRKLRWKRSVYCDGNKEVIVRVRYVRNTTETPDGGYAIRKKLYVTFHISTSERCSSVFWDPTNDMETPFDVYTEPSGTGSTPTGNNPTGNNPTGSTPTGNNPTGNNPTGNNPTGTGNKSTGNNPSSGKAVDTDSSNVSKLIVTLFFTLVALLF